MPIERTDLLNALDELEGRLRPRIAQLQGSAPVGLDYSGSTWADYSPPATGLGSYWRMGKTVFLAGLIKNLGAFAVNGLIATLPVGFRPVLRELGVVVTGDNATLAQVGRVDIYPNGQILWIAGASGAGNYLSLAGISFWATE